MTHRSDSRTTSTRALMGATAAALAMLFAFGGCAAHRTPEDEVLRASRATNDALRFRTSSNDETLELKSSGPLAVEIDNLAGDVTVRADRKVTSTYVDVRRVATHGMGRWNESRDALDETSWTATLAPRAGGGDLLTILTDTPSAERHFHRLEIVVVTPSLDTVKIRTRKGHVTVVENQGAVDIESSKGDVRVMTPWPMTSPMSIITSEGAIDYRVRGESKGAFDCQTIGGEVRQRCEYGHWRALASENDHDRFLAVLNGGTNPVVLRTTEGNIRVAVVPNPTAVGVIIRDP